jgi:fibronectin-binding autotransporter adhesin
VFPAIGRPPPIGAPTLIPGPSDRAVIAAAGSYTVTVTTSEAVGSVVLNDPGAILDISASPPGTLRTLAVSVSAVIKSGTLEIQGDGHSLPGGVLAIGGSLKVQSGGTLFLDGGTIEGGSLIIDKGGALKVQSSFPSEGSTLQNVAVLGGLTLNSGALVLSGNTTVENSDGTGPGAITLNGSQQSTYLVFAENYTLYNLTLNGGSVAGINATVTVGKGGLVQGQGNFVFGDFGYLALDNEGTINSNVNGQSLNIFEMPFVNDGLVKATNGGNISIDWNDAYAADDPWSNKAGAIISVTQGGTLQLGGNVTNDGLIKALHGTVYFGGDVPSSGTYEPQNAGEISVFDSALFFGATNTGVITAVNSTVHFAPSQFATHGVQNAGDIVTVGGQLFLGDASLNSPTPYQWQDSGLIATLGTKTDVEGNGDISAGGTLSIHGGSLSGPAPLVDDGQLKLRDASVDLASLTIGVGGELSGSGTVANPITNLGIIDAVRKLDLGGAVTGSGQLQISKGATLALDGPTSEAATFEGDRGTLFLDKANNFSGTVAALAKHDAIDLADFAFSSHPSITSVVGTGAAGSTTDVTVSDGSLTTTLQLLNQYAGQYPVDSTAYNLTSDHPGPANAGTLFTLAGPRGHNDCFVFAPNLGENAIANSTEHNDAFAPHISEFADLAALLVQAQHDGANLPAHDASGIVHHAEALTAQQAHHFLV